MIGGAQTYQTPASRNFREESSEQRKLRQEEIRACPPRGRLYDQVCYNA
jgi:hypothetical protein